MAADPLNVTVSALADPTRRAILARLATKLAKLSREIAQSPELGRYKGPEWCPGEDAKTDDDIAANIRTRVNTIFHPVGTCKMGVDPMAVVDPELRVRGIERLRVADASIMPSIIGGNTNAPVIMIAEKAASLLLDHGG